jgi:two-component system cell cycle response regulator
MIGKILIVDDVSTNRIVFKVKLTAAGYQTLMAADGESCVRMAMAEQPDIILLDLFLPDRSGIEVLKALKVHPQTRRIPVVMFSSEADAAMRLAALRAGAEDFMARPIDDQTLMARLRGLLRAREHLAGISAPERDLQMLGLAEPVQRFEMPGHVALVMPRGEGALHLKRALASAGHDRVHLMAADEVHSDQPGAEPDVYLIHADLSGPGGGLRMMSELLSRSTTRHAAFCIYNPEVGQTLAATAFDLGANDVVHAATPVAEIALRLRALVKHKREGDRMRASVQDGLRMAVFDPLTGLHNRRYGTAQLNAIADRARSEGSEFAVMVVDIDRFKSVNDRWGHATGDAVLIEVAARLASSLRATDLLARIGGEEFLIALPATVLTDAQVVAERLCRAIENSPVVTPEGVRVPVTISIGMTTGGAAPSDPVSVNELVAQADRALMHSKTHGRNQVTIVRKAA